MMRDRRVRMVLGAAFTVLALTVWPTLYRYHQTGPWTMRENRVTGFVSRLDESYGWQPVTRAPEVLTTAEALRRIEPR